MIIQAKTPLTFDIYKLSKVNDDEKVQNIRITDRQGAFKLFKIISENAILRENEHSFLGQRNENLNVYLLDKLNLNRVKNQVRFVRLLLVILIKTLEKTTIN
ncbi:hypothetical protein [Mesomycoplasma dispar]|uniref:hypothetical protein n=1 Tax=Mesomycoplasma dispar TaxID=86660 RepID=UPI000A57E8ED|nr:hypothetical protein [Mesomycoplasma dispar]